MVKPDANCDPIEALRRLLARGRLASKDATAAMVGLRFSPKQVRTARERLRVVVTRAGSGVTMHSMWELPPATLVVGTVGTNSSSTAEVQSELRPSPSVAPGPRARTPQKTSDGDSQPWPQRARARTSRPERLFEATAIDPPKLRRFLARVQAFQAKGIDQTVAKQLAGALQRTDAHAHQAFGSCGQCQRWQGRDCDRVRPILELHECWMRRQDIP